MKTHFFKDPLPKTVRDFISDKEVIKLVIMKTNDNYLLTQVIYKEDNDE